jgi:hypothetical protein
MEYFKHLDSTLTNDGRCTCEIKSGIAVANAAFNKKMALFTSKVDVELRRNLVKCCLWSIALYDDKTWKLGADQKYLESFEI